MQATERNSPTRRDIARRSKEAAGVSEAARPQDQRSLPQSPGGPPSVKCALVHATSVLTIRDLSSHSERVLSVDMRPLVIHLLAGLEKAGIERAVVTLGHNAAQVAECIAEYGFTQLQIDFVYLTLGSAVGTVWRNLANSVIAARTAFTGAAPLLIVRADNLYDVRLLRKIAQAPFDRERRFEAYALVDTTPATIRWATGARPKWLRVALADGDRQRVIRCGPRLGSFDGVVAGEVYATTPRVFEQLAALFANSFSTNLADAMSALADRGELGVVEAGELSQHWFESRTLAGVFRPPQPGTNASWGHLHQAARELLYSGEWRPTANMPTPPVRGELEKRTEPLLQLGSTLGEGANGVVVEAERGPAAEALSSRLAVKMFKAGTEDRGRVEEVMWEVHVLRQLRGCDHIVKLCDVVELADVVVYVVMERVEGPDLADYISAQPDGVLSESSARLMFRHILAALRFAHARGFLHCDLKPENVRLQEGVGTDGGLRAVLVDWGLARKIDAQPTSTTMGTALYASPEQLTGYSADSAWGRARLGPSADVWALGVTLYEMLIGRTPFVGNSHEELASNALALNYRLDDVLSLPARQIIDSMLQVLPSDRASVHELCVDPWTTAEAGPMPPDEESVLVQMDDSHEHEHPPRTARERLRRSCRSDRGRRIALRICYGVIVVGALVLGASRTGGAPVAVLDEQYERQLA